MARAAARVLIIAGSDPGGGAGIQADIKTVTALGGYAMTAITALTAQNTEGVFGIHDVPPPFVEQQIDLVLSDIGADCIKIGMLHRTEIIETVAAALRRRARDIPIVLDPVMFAKGGHALLMADAVGALKEHLVPPAALVTPNLPEARELADGSGSDPRSLGERILAIGPRAVLVKGGHGEGRVVRDTLTVRHGADAVFEDERIDTPHTHGTGCTLASAIACGLAQGLAVVGAVARARCYVREAMRSAPGLGHGHGPLNHGHTVSPYMLDRC